MPHPSMTTRATWLYPFVPSGPQFARSIEFFVAMGFEVVGRDQGLAGLRCGGGLMRPASRNRGPRVR